VVADLAQQVRPPGAQLRDAPGQPAGMQHHPDHVDGAVEQVYIDQP